MSLFSMTLTMFLIMNSVGHLPGFLELTKSIDPKKRLKIVAREMLIALFIMLLFNFLGEYLLHILELGSQSILIAGGLILFLISIKMIFPKEKTVPSLGEISEPFIIPIATPMIAGPSILTTIMLYAHFESKIIVVMTSVFIAWGLSMIILLFAENIKKIIGIRALIAVERLMGLLLTMMAVEMLLKGVKAIILHGPKF